MFIDIVSNLTDEIYNSICRLILLLGVHKKVPTYDEIVALVDSEVSKLLIARYPDKDSEIVGILTISIYRVPTGVRSIVEDFVVDVALRRRGIASALMFAAIDIARDAGANGVALTSNPQRVEANLLYQKMGFEKRETNAYFYRLA